MWHEYMAYLIIAVAFLYAAYRIGRSLTRGGTSSSCATCTATCKLKGLKAPDRKEKKKNCMKKHEKSNR